MLRSRWGSPADLVANLSLGSGGAGALFKSAQLFPVPSHRVLMKIILAAPRGFCAGVNMAIDSLELTLQKFGPPVYVYHEIVHNQYVVSQFREKGAVFVESIEEVPQGSVLLFSAHGVSPAIRQAAKEVLQAYGVM